jgi:hypothetical protein
MSPELTRDILEAVSEKVRFKPSSDAHPYGSTVAVERHVEVELTESWVSLPVDSDELIPVAYNVLVARVGVEARVRLSNPQVRGGLCTYDAEVVS